MKVLVIGSGGREHAIAWKLAKSHRVERVFCAPGNGGTALEYKCENIKAYSIGEYVDFAKENNIDITIVGPEDPLVNGIVDEFKKNGLKVFGPHKEAAQLEGSKIFAKDFMKKHGVKTAEYEVFTNIYDAKDYIEKCKYPMVIKADGLAAGKGVVICENKEEALDALNDIMVKDVFNGAGSRIVIEEFLRGVEASILSITDGKVIVPFLSSKDHKQIFDGDKGPNTGGMGVIAPNPYCTEKVLSNFNKHILEPTLKGIKEENLQFNGIVFFGIMIINEETYLLEYNIRMGDPETQAVLSLMESDFVDIIENCIDGKLAKTEIKWKNAHATCVIGAANGYPAAYEKGKEIVFTGDLRDKLFIAGGKLENSKLLTNGGRVVAVVEQGATLEESIKNAYKTLEKVNFEGMYYRNDIGYLYDKLNS